MTMSALPVMKRPLAGAIHLGDCLDVLTTFPDDTVDLVATSPPYADQRSQTYGGIHPDKYAEWMSPCGHSFITTTI